MYKKEKGMEIDLTKAQPLDIRKEVWVERGLDVHIVKYVYEADPSRVVFINEAKEVSKYKDMPSIDVAILGTLEDLKVKGERLINVLERVSIQEGYLPIKVEACTIREATGKTSITSQQLAALETISRDLALSLIKQSIPPKLSLFSILKDSNKLNKQYIANYINSCINLLEEDYREKAREIYKELLDSLDNPVVIELHNCNKDTKSQLRYLFQTNNSYEVIDVYKLIPLLKELFPMGVLIKSSNSLDKALGLEPVDIYIDFNLLTNKLKPTGINLIDNSPKENSYEVIDVSSRLVRLLISLSVLSPSGFSNTKEYLNVYIKLRQEISIIKNLLPSVITKNDSVIKKFSRYGTGIYTGKLKTSEKVGVQVFRTPEGKTIEFPVVYFHPDCAIYQLLGLENPVDVPNTSLLNNLIALGRSPMGSWVFAIGLPSYQHGFIGHATISSLIASKAHASDGDGDPFSVFRLAPLFNLGWHTASSDKDLNTKKLVESIASWNEHPMSLGGDDNSYLDFISHPKSLSNSPLVSETSVPNYLRLIEDVAKHYSFPVGSFYNLGSALSFAASVNPSLAPTTNIAWRGLYEQQALSGWNPSRESCYNLLNSTKQPSKLVYSFPNPNGSTSFSYKPPSVHSSTVLPIPSLSSILNCSYEQANTIFSFHIKKTPTEQLCRELSRGSVSIPVLPNTSISLSILDSLIWNLLLFCIQ